VGKNNNNSNNNNGPLSETACQFLKDLGRRISAQSGDERERERVPSCYKGYLLSFSDSTLSCSTTVLRRQITWANGHSSVYIFLTNFLFPRPRYWRCLGDPKILVGTAAAAAAATTTTTNNNNNKTDGQHYRRYQGVHLPVPAADRGTTEGECGRISKHVHRQLARCNPLFHFLNVLVPTSLCWWAKIIIIKIIEFL